MDEGEEEREEGVEAADVEVAAVVAEEEPGAAVPPAPVRAGALAVAAEVVVRPVPATGSVVEVRLTLFVCVRVRWCALS
jgi:hypothetical protein